LKAIFIHNHGGIDVLEYGDFPTPEPGPNQVLVRLKAAALNRLDQWVREVWNWNTNSYPISEAGAAQEKLTRGEQMGKITLALD